MIAVIERKLFCKYFEPVNVARFKKFNIPYINFSSGSRKAIRVDSLKNQ
jgi:hypothetical protein